ncbi:hypothetical protein [Marinobacter sp. ATCH36]|uniref:hypothetical protein n=1 Tax=Marinobacter sp. ATCH36 TaxID=2945106 RepID=UPI002020F7AF|nr:hypothetical protein [Marinobacter sp. ATCH36]MCL7945413.1 hypothetical protein [Marinobacter sp. ATCH36]
MESGKVTPVDLQSGKQRRLRYTFATLNTAILITTIVSVVWIFGKIIAALHALVFSLVFADTPEQQSPNDFMKLEDITTWVEVRSTVQYRGKARDGDSLYTLDRNEGANEGRNRRIPQRYIQR